MGWFFISLIWLISVTACLDNSGGSDGSDSSDVNVPSMVAIKQDIGGVVTAEITASADRPQQINASPSSAITGAAVLFPSGSLPASTSVTIQQGEPIALPVLASTLGLGTGIRLAAATRAVVVSAAKPMDANSPFAIALPIITDSTGLLDNYDLSKLVIIYIALDATNNQSHIGLIPNSDLAIVGGRVQLKTNHFGLYQGAFSATPLPDRIDLPTKKSILTSKIAATLPGVSWQPVIASYLNDQLQVSTVVNGVVSLQECLVSLVTESSSWPIFTAEIGANTTGSIPIKVAKPGNYVAQLICTEENGRVVTSPWSRPFILSNGSSPPTIPPPSSVKTDKVFADVHASPMPTNWQRSTTLFSNTGRSTGTPFLTATNTNGATVLVFTGAGSGSSLGTFAGVMSDFDNIKVSVPRRIGELQAMESIAAAIDNLGNALVLWPKLAEDGSSYLSGSYFNANVQDYDAWTGVDPDVSSTSETSRPPGTVTSNAAVAAGPAGQFRTVWVEQSPDGNARLYTRIFDHESKTWVGNAQKVHSETLDLSSPPLIRIDSVGNTAVLSSTKGSDSHTLRLDYSAANSGSNWSVYTIAQSLLSTEITSLNWAMDPATGQSFIVWWDSVTGFKARSFSRGKLQGIANLPASGQIKEGQKPLEAIQVGVDQLGNAVFTWRARDGVYTSYLERSATVASEAVLISTLDLDDLYLNTDASTGNSLLVGVQRVNGRVGIHTMQRQSNNASWSAISMLNLLIPLDDPTLVIAQGGLSVTASGIFNLLWASDENSAINLIQLR